MVRPGPTGTPLSDRTTLVAKGYVARVPDRRSYALGARLISLSHVCLRQVDLPRRAQPFVERVNAATGEAYGFELLLLPDPCRNRKQPVAIHYRRIFEAPFAGSIVYLSVQCGWKVIWN